MSVCKANACEFLCNTPVYVRTKPANLPLNYFRLYPSAVAFMIASPSFPCLKVGNQYSGNDLCIQG